MIKSLNIKNFRCFKQARLDGLRRVNIIVGRNATGKTVLLESLFLAAGGSPLIVLNLRQMRGMGNAIQIGNVMLSRLWEDLFCGFDVHLPIEIDSIGTAQDSNSVFISEAGEGSLTLPLTEGEEKGDSTVTEAPLTFVWKREGMPTKEIRPKLTAQGFRMEASPSSTSVVMFPANYTLDPEETSRRLSDIRKKNELPFLLETIKAVFPDVVDVSTENNQGVWMVYISTASVASQMIPMALHSAGMNRFVACLLGIASAPKGIVLIDEIENGLYYKTMPDIWKAIYRFADRYKTQVFATTHSEECLKAAQQTVQAAPGDFSLVRASLDGDERSLEWFSGEKLEGALESGFELR